ncbi:hypothetical protein L211DRAFT_867524 [Terfezia boudieri ATCC MYA-4762]|uniref:Uncharacterized protein n=1 Tax=Terfezia boudieri ATCC MYA-4762 TaxID=1051890 RepID=A0A3N4LTU7_9PEZI|nr:hypothetical protein L211DRAFT_867524 [Terfezia boudieri ATCC MYA-4762]
MAGTISYGAFRSIIDIYNFDSTTGETLGIGSPIRGHANKTQILHRTQRKLSSILQTYFYNLTPSPWSPPTAYLALHHSLETLEDVLHQLIRCEIDDRLGTLGLITHGLLDLMQELELLLMSSKVDGPRDEKWWERFAKALLDDGSSSGKQYREAQENVEYFTWVGKMILRVSAHGDYTRRISATEDKLDVILSKVCEELLGLYARDRGAGEESFDLKAKFSDLAMYDRQCFIGKVTFEAALRVWMFWDRKAISRLNRMDVDQCVPPDAYLDLLKSCWLFTLMRKDLRSRQLSDELKALISLISSELLFTLKLLQEKCMHVPDLDALVAEGKWAILLQSGFEDWELEGHDNSFAPSRKIEATYVLPNLAWEHSTEDLNDAHATHVEPSFKFSPIIFRDDLDEDHFEGEDLDLKTPLPVHRKQGKEGQKRFSRTLYESSHSSTSSLYSVYSNDTCYSESVTEEEEEEVDMALEPEPESPDIRSMMSPAAVPQSEYEMYQPLDSSYWEEISPTKEDSLPHNKGRQKANYVPGGSRFHEHLSIDLTTKPLHRIPDISIGIDHGDTYIASTKLSCPDLHPPPSPLAPPPLIKDPNAMLSPTETSPFTSIAGGGSAKHSTRPRIPVGGTMSSAGGRSSAAAMKPSESCAQLIIGAGPKEEITSTTTGAIYKCRTKVSTVVPVGASLAVPCVGMSGKENPRTIPTPLQLPKKPSNSLARALKTARADIHEKGGWGSLLNPSSGTREKNEFSPAISSGSILTSRRVPDNLKIPLTPVEPLSVASGEVVAVNKEIREPINKNDISSPTPARKLVPPKKSEPIEPQGAAAAVVTQRKKSQKETKANSKARVLKNTARATLREKGNDYYAQPGEVEILPKELLEVNALVSDTGLPTGKWGECVLRMFKRDNGIFRLVTFRDGLVDEDFIDPSDTELVPEYAHHMHETVPIIFLRKVTEKAAVDKELLEENGKGRRQSVRSSFGCVGDGTLRMTTKHIGAETFYYRFRRLDDMFNFQLAWLGELVVTDIPSVKCIRFKKGLVGGESVTARARLQIWREVPAFHEHGRYQGKKNHGKVTNTRIVMYWDEMICTTFITENVDIEAKQKALMLRLKSSARRPAFNNSIRARIFGQSLITTPATLVPGHLSASTCGAINLDQGAKGGFSDEEQFDDFKWFDIEFYEENEMKWFYQDFMRCQKDRIRESRALTSAEKLY